MIVNGYVKDYKYAGDGTLLIQVRIPTIHGPMDQKQARGKQIRNYVRDKDLPYYPSLLLPHLPVMGEVVALTSLNEKTTEFMVLGLTGGSYQRTIEAQPDYNVLDITTLSVSNNPNLTYQTRGK